MRRKVLGFLGSRRELIVAAIMLVSCSPAASPSPAPPTPTASGIPTVQATPSLTATPAPTATVAAGLTRYVNAELGYSVDLPSGWRRASCSRGVTNTSPLEASDWFVNAPEAEETIAGGVRLVLVRVFDAAGSTPLTWLQQSSSQPDTRFEAVTLNGRSGARGFIGASGATYTFAVASRDWIYAIDWPYFGGPDAELEGMIATLRILDDATVGRVPKATPVPRTIESLVDALADGFTRKDLQAIAGLMAPCVTVGGVPGDAFQRSGTAYINALGTEFAAGTSVQVRSRPIESDPSFGRFVRSTFRKPGEPDQRVDFVLRADGDRWSVGAVLIRALGN